jgi:hypothetical protein
MFYTPIIYRILQCHIFMLDKLLFIQYLQQLIVKYRIIDNTHCVCKNITSALFSVNENLQTVNSEHHLLLFSFLVPKKNINTSDRLSIMKNIIFRKNLCLFSITLKVNVSD